MSDQNSTCKNDTLDTLREILNVMNAKNHNTGEEIRIIAMLAKHIDPCLNVTHDAEFRKLYTFIPG